MKNISDTKLKWIILGIITFLSFIVRISTASVFVTYPDSALYLSFAKSILNGRLFFDFAGGNNTILPPLYSLVIAFFSLFTGNIEKAGVLVSILSGAILIIPVFYIAKTVYNEKAAWVSTAFVFFSPILINWSTSMLTESLFITLFISGIAGCLYGIENKKLLFILVSGGLIGLSYMTRVVGIVVIPVLGIWMLIHYFSVRKPADNKTGMNWKDALVPVIVFSIGFILVTGLYLVKLHSFYGYWTIAGSYGSIKGTIAYEGAATPAGWENIKKGAVKESALLRLVKKILLNLQNYSLALLAMLTIGTIFVIAGLLFRWKVLYLVSVIVVYFSALLVQPLSPMIDERIRYLSPVFPLLLIIVSAGILRIGDLIKSQETRKILVPAMIVLVLLSFTLHLILFPVKLHFMGKIDDKYVRETVGLWMKKELPHPLRVMSRKPFMPYYADAIWFNTPATYIEMLQLAKEKSVDYIVLEREFEYERRPELRFLFYPKQVPPELSYIGGLQSPKTGEVYIALYRINREIGKQVN
ncbi:MAG: glycosyltransferase family 39 protein [Nitrospirae bacterium]|nr:glycosyltransferase family 39 protein [Nitrospirota bacterium]